MKEIIVNSEFYGSRLDRFICKNYKHLSKMTVQKMIRIGKIKVNRKKTSADYRLGENDIINLFINDEVEHKKPKKMPPPDIVYEDDYILAINKASGILIHPDGKKEDSISERVEYYLSDVIEKFNGSFIPGVVNRLDYNTSGIVLSPKSPTASRELNALMQKGKITKKYYTLVRGQFKEKKRAVHYAVKDEEKNKMLLFDAPKNGAVEMISIFEPIKILENTTLLSVQLITGRTHQIRSQLANLGYPVAGDMKYGNATFNDEMYKKYKLKHQFLHCYEISFNYWVDHSAIRLFCDLPEELSLIVQSEE